MNTSIDLPACAVRTLHSAWVDYVASLPEPIRDAMIGRLEGLTFDRFVLGLANRRILVSARIVDDQALIGVAIGVEDGDDWLLFEVRGSHAGVDVAWLIASGLLDFDRELAELLGGQS